MSHLFNWLSTVHGCLLIVSCLSKVYKWGFLLIMLNLFKEYSLNMSRSFVGLDNGYHLTYLGDCFVGFNKEVHTV
jgi:hypothetical protein